MSKRSWITPLKHEIMWKLVSGESGVVDKGWAHRDITGMVWYDLTAGDAAPVDGMEWSRACSAGILAHHARLSSKPVRVALYEKAELTYRELLSNLSRELPGLGWSPKMKEGLWAAPNGSAIRAFLKPGEEADTSFIRKDLDAVMIFNDPYDVNGWAMRNDFLYEASLRTWSVRSLSTLGCNVNGIKRMDQEKRSRWFDFPDQVRRGQPNYRDMVLAAVDRNDAQWAYLIATSIKWREKTEKILSVAAGHVQDNRYPNKKTTVTTAWYRTQPEKFKDVTERLFLRKEERGES